MKKRTRRIIFWLAVIVFACASWLVVLYAQGYRYDFKSGRLVRTGAIAVTANTDAKLFVDDALVGPLSFISHRGGSDHLLPGSYSVRLVKDGWSEWNKTVAVQEGLLTDFPKIMLLPNDENSLTDLRQEASKSLAVAYTLADATPTPLLKGKKPTPAPKEVDVGNWQLKGMQLWHMENPASGSMVADNVLGFAPTDNNDRILWWTRNELDVLWIKNTDYQPYHIDGDTELVSRWSAPILRAAWFRDRDHIVVDLGIYGYRVIETDTRGGTNIIKL